MNKLIENTNETKDKALLRPKIDVVFHALFREENNKLTEALISDILGEKVTIKENLNRHLDIKAANEKLGVMDLKVALEDGSICNIEIQLKRQKKEEDRFLYYWANAYFSQLKRGDKYSKLNRAISIIILDHEIELLDEFSELDVKWIVTDNKGHMKRLTSDFEIAIIEIPRAKRMYSQNAADKIGQWMMFLDNPNSKEVSCIMNKNEDIKQAAEELKQVSGDDELRRIAELREKAIRDEAAAIEYATEEDLKRGIEQEQKKIIKNMLTHGFDEETISEITGVSKEDVSKFK